jgi:polyisoprenoid-binding protein YceI
MLQKALGSVAVAGWLVSQAAAPAGVGPMVLAIDAADSRVTILVGKTGLLSFAGHAHEVVAPAVGGRVTFDPTDLQGASVSLDFDASALRVTGKDESAADVPQVQSAMLSDQVLDVARFPRIAFKSRRIVVSARTATSATLQIEGDMTLHGTTRPMTIRAAATLDPDGRVTARGSFTLKQTEFGMVPVTAVGGTVRVKDDLDIQFVLKASPSHETNIKY